MYTPPVVEPPRVLAEPVYLSEILSFLESVELRDYYCDDCKSGRKFSHGPINTLYIAEKNTKKIKNILLP